MTCRACSGRGSQPHIGAHVSEPCDKCAPTSEEVFDYQMRDESKDYCGDCQTSLTDEESELGIFCAKCAKSVPGYYDEEAA